MEPGMPPALAAAGPAGRQYPLERRGPHSDPAEPGKGLLRPVHTERLCHAPVGGDGGHPAPADALRRVYGDAAPALFYGTLFRHAAVLYPCMENGGEAELSLVLDAKSPLCVERAAMDVAEV